MGMVPDHLAEQLRSELRLRRAVETGTYYGGGARRMARVFPEVVTIELSEQLHLQARLALANEPRITLLHGDSRALLPELVDPSVPTLFFLDGHWSGGPTAGHGMECPVLDELEVLANGHPDDCLFVDDARLFAAPPPPPHDPAQWPTLLEVFDAVRAAMPRHHVTLLEDLVIAVPARAKPLVDAFGQRRAARSGAETATSARRPLFSRLTGRA